MKMVYRLHRLVLSLAALLLCSNVPSSFAQVQTDAPSEVETLLAANSTTFAPSSFEIGKQTASDSESESVPTDVPTEAATIDVLQTTAAPTVAPTMIAIITVAPTNMPTIATLSPTLSPTNMPTVATLSPTEMTEAPTTVPTGTPTEETLSPTFITTTSPTEMETEIPSTAPSDAPSLIPTSAPTLSVAPTESDATGAPSVSPTVSTKPTVGEDPTTLVDENVENLVMTLVGMNQIMTPDAIADWVKVTEDHTVEWYDRNSNLLVTDLETTVSLVEQNIIQSSRLRRGLQPVTSIQVKYDQRLSYNTADPDNFPATDVALGPFSNRGDLNTYLESLQAANDEFADVTSVADIGEGGGGSNTEAPIVEPDDDDDDGLGTAAIIGIAVGCAAAVALVGGVGYYVSQRGDDGGYVTASGKTPPSQLDVGMRPDDVSTLGGEPNTYRQSSVRQSGLATISGESAGGYGDQSVATVDYDYSKAYGGGGDNSVSSAGGTFGSQTHTQAAGGAATLGASGTSASLATASQFRGQNSNVREELIDIYAPPGKLGVVIDTPDDGAPVVHAVKDSSVIADKLQVGDKLVAVDDEDVRSMTAIKVSKLISRKSANASRKLSIIRTVVVDE